MNQTVETVISSLKTIYAQNGLSSVPFKGNDRDLVYEGMRAVQKKKKKKERKKERKIAHGEIPSARSAVASLLLSRL